MNKKFSLIAFLAIFLGIAFVGCDMSKVTSMKISDTRMTMLLSQVDTLVAEAQYDGDIVPSFVWTSSNPQVVSVNKGEIKALKKGVAVIKAYSGSKSVECQVTVTDEVLTTFTKGEIIFYGDVHNTRDSYNYLVVLGTAGVNLDDFSGFGEIIQIEFNSSLFNTTGIDIGKYNFVNFNTALFAPFTLVPGYLVNDVEFWGSWYFGGIASDLYSGDVIVKYANNAYELDYQMLDGFGNKVKGVYKGQLKFYNESNAAGAKAARMKKMQNMQKTLKRSL